MEKKPELFKVDLSKKYILTFPGQLSYERRMQILEIIREWIHSDNPFLILPEGVKLERVDDLDHE